MFMEQKFETTTAEFRESSGIGYLTLERPAALNALSSSLKEDIINGLQWLEKQNKQDDGIKLRTVILEGANGNFSAGADINEFDESRAGTSSDRHHCKFIMDFPLPIIAKIQGYCLGGGLETAMACDFRFATPSAQFGLPEVDLGLIPGAGGVQYISTLANPSIAKEVAMTGDKFDSKRAKEYGIVNHVTSDIDAKTTEFAKKIASKPPLAIQAIKKSSNMSIQTNLREGCHYDRQLFEPLLNTDDFQEGSRSFANDDYEPDFTGK